MAVLALVVASAAAGCATSATAVKPGPERGPAAHAGVSAGSTAARRPAPAHRPRHRRTGPHPRASGPAVSVSGVPAAAMPDPALTPGKARTADRAVVCVPGYSSRVRDVPSSESDAVYERYGVAHVPYAHEVDHLVSLEIGGSNAITNLWPEPYAGRWGARTKDVLENRLHALVCSGGMSLPYAQHIEATNWVAAYKKYVGSPPPEASSTHHRRTATASRSAAGNCEPGYSPCLPRVADLNCADIPASDKPVRVTGSDPYGLDADGNGYGCTS